MRVRLLLCSTLAFACSAVQIEDGGGGGAGGGGAAMTSPAATTPSSSSIAGSTSSTTGAGGMGGEGGVGPFCGDGSVDDGEECDDGNVMDDDACSAGCIVECEVSGQTLNEAVWKDPVTHHCYRWTGGTVMGGCGAATFAASETDCVAWLGHLAALSTLDEHAAVVASELVDPLALDVFLGGYDATGMGDWTWTNGEPWTFQPGAPPWQSGEPIGGTYLEIYSDGAFNADVDGSACGWVCERTPAGLAPPP